MTTHGQLVQRASKAIEELFSDTSVSQETTLDDLDMLVEDIGMRIEAIKCDMEDQT